MDNAKVTNSRFEAEYESQCKTGKHNCFCDHGGPDCDVCGERIKATVATKGRMTKAKRERQERLDYLARFLADEMAKPIRLCVDTSRIGYKALWYDRTSGQFHLSTSGNGTPCGDERWTELSEAFDAFDAFMPRER